jgi:thioesterase domain-containing protein/acyl carrier protein
LIAPRTEIEAELTAIWVELLRIEPVGVQDDYFDLGGTSLLAVDLFARIEQQFGKKLPLTSLIEASTIEQLAQLVAGASDGDSLVLIRDGEGGPPLFLVHDGDGETMLYRNLALRLSSNHAIYGLQPYSRPNVPMAHTRIADMAAYHIDKMRSVQPRGPYLVGGMCAGGVVAFEIALQLQSEGEKVSLVALIDAADVKAPLKPLHFANQRMHRFLSAVPHDRSALFSRRMFAVVATVLHKTKKLSTYTVARHLSLWRDEARMKVFQYFQNRGWRLPRALEHMPVRTVYLFAEKHYKPMILFDGDVALFRATQGNGDDEPYVTRYRDPVFGWGQRVTRRVEVYDVPGGHSSMLQEPHVGTLASQLQAAMDKCVIDELVSVHEVVATEP